MSSKPERKVLRLVHTDRKPDFIFLAHWVETWNWLLKFVHELHRNPQHARRWMWLWPVYAVVSLVYLFRRTAYSLVDRFIFEGEVGETMLLTNFGWHFALRRLQLLIRRRILQAVLAAEVRGAKVIGLGALTKAEWLTEGGAWITRAIPNLKARIVHGDTLTAAVVIRQALQLIKRFSLNIWPVFITGATSKIGRAVTLLLLQQDIRVIMFTESDERFEEMKAEAGKNGRLLERAVSLEDGRSCLFWITGKAFPDGKTILRHLPQDGIVLNFSVPDPLSPRLLKEWRAYWQTTPPRLWLFPNRQGTRPIDVTIPQKLYTLTKLRAGIRKQGGIHALRHAFATHLIEAGRDLPTVQHWLGHRFISSTLRYFHLSQGRFLATPSPLDLPEPPAA